MINVGLNLSILDGWWDEAYLPENGWAIGGAIQFGDDAKQDESEERMLFDVLEHQIAPLYFRRDDNGLPLAWMLTVKAFIGGLVPRFDARWLVQEYWIAFYKILGQ